ncbi:hypothetical protein ARMSODRAFT_1009808 [Armillaria solidipes]|uniref:Uncharacterized protein n=1 Tax=Armillaria solidipes TaxID=1076256 RepID=A0A2H3B632_9AGAR|nr:hypothetical protein ARMSODRAFT_1009808 [Armillaria solidipes]
MCGKHRHHVSGDFPSPPPDNERRRRVTYLHRRSDSLIVLYKFGYWAPLYRQERIPGLRAIYTRPLKDLTNAGSASVEATLCNPGVDTQDDDNTAIVLRDVFASFTAASPIPGCKVRTVWSYWSLFTNQRDMDHNRPAYIDRWDINHTKTTRISIASLWPSKHSRDPPSSIASNEHPLRQAIRAVGPTSPLLASVTKVSTASSRDRSVQTYSPAKSAFRSANRLRIHLESIVITTVWHTQKGSHVAVPVNNVTGHRPFTMTLAAQNLGSSRESVHRAYADYVVDNQDGLWRSLLFEDDGSSPKDLPALKKPDFWCFLAQFVSPQASLLHAPRPIVRRPFHLPPLSPSPYQLFQAYHTPRIPAISIGSIAFNVHICVDSSSTTPSILLPYLNTTARFDKVVENENFSFFRIRRYDKDDQSEDALEGHGGQSGVFKRIRDRFEGSLPEGSTMSFIVWSDG